ncbi:hypothetical protein EC396_15960 [Lutibacter sp. HS1-25]|uniref:hypothetical protein n=1 Tax=Lutibacter sp. HS1-25 TaxID=2485000 RepID=UPI0010109B31|nr:hypothetical protein [Lutibacter sp. HS1-25]RXP45185.1 hypothetical protein EC396_15960 [Lutibacter sp. HS1-25]
MKKLMLTAIAIVIATSTLFATNVNPDDTNKNIRSQIVTLMEAPDFTVAEDLTVTIQFTFNSEGEIIVLDIDSKDSNVLKYIRKNLNHKFINNPGEKDKLYIIPLKVKRQ